MQAREEALRNSHVRAHFTLDSIQGICQPSLNLVTQSAIQNQTGPYPNKWCKTGVVVEVRQHHQKRWMDLEE